MIISDRDFIKALYAHLLERPSTLTAGMPDDALPIGEDPITRAPRWLASRDLSPAAALFGGSGRGKSTLLRVFLWLLLIRKIRFGEGLLLFDPHGTLSNWFLKLIAVVAPWLAPEVFYLDFKQARGKALQFGLLSGSKEHAYYGACLSTEAILKGTGMSSVFDKPSATRTLQNGCQALLELGLSLNDIRFFMQSGQDERAVRAALLDKLSPPVRGFFSDLSAKPASTQDTYCVAPLNRTDMLTRTRAIARTQVYAGIDMVSFIAKGPIGIVNGEIAGTDVTPDGRNAFMAMLANRALTSFEQLPENHRRPFTIVADEAADYLVGSTFARSLSTIRKFGGRILVASQRLEDFVLKDGDLALLRAVLAIPTKLCLGGLPFSECKTLSEETHLRLIDPQRIKSQLEHIVWDPDMKKVVLRGKSRGGATTDSEGETTTQAQSRQTTATRNRSTGGGRGPDGRESDSWSDGDAEATGDSDSESEARSRSFAETNSWSESEQEAWVNFPKPRVEKMGNPVFTSIEEQVWTHAKRMKLQPTGLGIVSRDLELPFDVAFPHLRDFEFDDEAIEPFLDIVMDKPDSTPCVELDRQLEDRPRQLLEAAEPQPVTDDDEANLVPIRRHARRRRVHEPR